jgi:hypothetical protein
MEYSPYNGGDDFSAPPYTLLHEFVRPDGVREKHVIFDGEYTIFEVSDDIHKKCAALANPESIQAQEVIGGLYLDENEDD